MFYTSIDLMESYYQECLCVAYEKSNLFTPFAALSLPFLSSDNAYYTF